MSKVKIQGNASGTGVVTLTAPATSTDRTITLPDSTGTVLMTDGDGSNLTGTADATKLPLTGGTLTNTLTVQNNVSSNTDPSLILSGTGNLSQDCYLQMAECWTGLPLAMGMDNSTNTFKIARNSSGNLNSGTQLEITSDGRGLSQFTAKMWIHLNMAAATIGDSHNVSSITDVSTGEFNVTFANSMSNTSYSVNSAALNGYISGHKNFGTGSITIMNGDSDWTAVDINQIGVQVFGD
jgi:hypothetical protein